jgi:xanthine dehydrogenase accessory factor
MKDIVDVMRKWLDEGRTFALARVVQTWGSSPRPVGSALLVSKEMEMAGSVSGGCVEGAVLKEAVDVIEKKMARRLSYGVTDDEAWAVGLTCGGKIQVLLQPISPDPFWRNITEKIPASQNFGLVTRLADGVSINTFIDISGRQSGPDIPAEVLAKTKAALTKGVSLVVEADGANYFIHTFPKRNQLLMIGAAHITADLVLLAGLYDFETIVIDPRSAFANKTQFAVMPDKVIAKYPSEVLSDFELDGHTYAVVLSHDPKIDDDALRILLRSKVAYIGALGSRSTHEKRVARLKEGGFTNEEISRIESPVGMSIQAQGANEIALSIMGSIIRTKNQHLSK